MELRKPEIIEAEIEKKKEEIEENFYFVPNHGCSIRSLKEANEELYSHQQDVKMLEDAIFNAENDPELRALEDELRQAREAWEKQTSMFEEK